jgi:hypothetical protein
MFSNSRLFRKKLWNTGKNLSLRIHLYDRCTGTSAKEFCQGTRFTGGHPEHYLLIGRSNIRLS